MCYDYLLKQNCVLWGQHYDIKDTTGRQEAAKWLSEIIEEVMR